MNYSEFLKVYIASVKPLNNEALFCSVYEQMSEYRQKKVDRIKPLSSKRESLGAGWLLKYAFKAAGMEELFDQIAEGENGKPYITGNDKPEIYFNLSHSNEMVMCAVSSKPVGCDIQYTKRGDAKIANRCYFEEEKNYVFEYPDDEELIRSRFFRIWTMKEAFTKLTGEGIQREFNSFSVFDRPEYFIEKDIEDYKLAVCTTFDFNNVNFNNIDIS